MTAWRSSDTAPGYYGNPIVKAAPWRDEIGWYFFTGGLAGASSVLAAAAQLGGQPTLAAHARAWALAGLAPSPVLLVVDLGRRDRFANMLRVLKPTSPMSVGSWLLTAYGPTATLAAALTWRHRPNVLVDVIAGALGAAVATYTAVLVSDTATPVWRHAQKELPFLFAASAAASAGAAASLSTPTAAATPARLLAAAGGLSEVAVARVMERRLGPQAEARRRGRAETFRTASEVLTVAGCAVVATARRRLPRAIGALALLGGAACQRLCVLESGRESARDPVFALRD